MGKSYIACTILPKRRPARYSRILFPFPCNDRDSIVFKQRLQYVTKDLDAVAKRYGTQTDKMVNVIKETAEIQKKIKRSQEAHVMQIVIKDILRADRDHNFELDESELEGLKRKLSLMPDVKLDSANFDALTKGKNGLSLKDVVEMFRNLLSSDDLRDEEKIFHLEKGKQKPWYQL